MKNKIGLLLITVMSLITFGKVNAQDYKELVRYDREKNMLVFQNEESMRQVYDILEKQLDETDNREPSDDGYEDFIEDNIVLRDFGKSVGFYEQSLRYTFLLSEFKQLENGATPKEIIRPKVRNHILQSLLNEDYAMQVGEEIMLVLPGNRILLKKYDLEKIKKLVDTYVNIRDGEVNIEDLVAISDDERSEIQVLPNEDCKPDFTFSDFSSNNEVEFTYIGTPSDPTVSYAWDFGDGSTLGTVANPKHKYGIPKNYIVTLSITQKDKGVIICTNKISKTLNTQNNCTSTFTSSGYLTDLSGKFLFTGKVVVGMKFSWDFGDGTSSSEQNPSKTYTTKGPKQVCLTVESPNCNAPSKTCKTILGGTVNTDCIAAYTYTNSTGVPCLICFKPAPTDILSSDPITGYEWTFGDEEKSTETNPCHKYACNGDKTVTLKITTKSGQTCTSSLQSLVPINVSNCECCQRNVLEEKRVAVPGSSTQEVIYQIDSDQKWIGRKEVNAEMWYYELQKGKWKKAKANMQIDIWGNVLGESPEGCKCKVNIPVNETGKSNKWHHQITRHDVGDYFGHKKNTGEWGANFMLNGNLIFKVSSNPFVTCE